MSKDKDHYLEIMFEGSREQIKEGEKLVRQIVQKIAPEARVQTILGPKDDVIRRLQKRGKRF